MMAGPGEHQVSDLICVGIVTSAVGVKGEVRIKTFTDDPMAFGNYGPVQDEAGARIFEINGLRIAKKGIVARLSGVKDRDEAEALCGTELFVARALLPKAEEDEFYHADLIGMRVNNMDGEPIGQVSALYDFGAGDLLEIDHKATGKRVLIPFTLESVPTIDVETGCVVIDPPDGTFPEPKSS